VLSGGNDPGPRRQLIAALVLLGLLLAGSLWITGALRGASAIQDCVQAGRSNCAPIDARR
jgi:MYXO-CTERM domain-containing protein